eukprot:TRINITY_DN10914_c0_g1_i1.p1 TRINITY_DN10914_c0_g1~~TRINITY_DN10914_c0_g1_i1.p1  ORF type:complete len:274 (-),score=87.05 TRINITY_DN10914_c0_g1_i1:70-891(-)
MSDNEADTVPPSQILKKLSKETLRKLYIKERHEDSEVPEASKTHMREHISKIIDETGLDCMLTEMKRDDLKLLADALKIEFVEGVDNKNSKPVLSSKIRSAFEKKGFEDFLKKDAKDDLLEKLCKTLEIETDKDTKMAEEVIDKIKEYGASKYWNACDLDLLHAATSDLKMKTAKNTNSKRKLVEALLTDSAPEKERKKKKRKIEFSEKKPAIAQGVSKDDLFQYYNITELQKWLKTHNMKTSGKKKELIDRISTYLEEDDEEEEKKGKSSDD